MWAYVEHSLLAPLVAAYGLPAVAAAAALVSFTVVVVVAALCFPNAKKAPPTSSPSPPPPPPLTVDTPVAAPAPPTLVLPSPPSAAAAALEKRSSRALSQPPSPKASRAASLPVRVGEKAVDFQTRATDTQLEHLTVLSSSRTRLPRAVAYPAVELTPEELALVALLKDRADKEGLPRSPVANHAATDSFIGRFVRGKHCNEAKAWEQFRGSLLWRQANRVDTVLDWYRKEFADSAKRLDAYYPWQDHGVDNNGVPVTWDRLPSMDFKVLMGAFTADELINWHLERMEAKAHIMAQRGVYGGIFVEDFTGLSMAHWYKPAVDMLKMMMNVDANNYPEYSSGIFYINAPRVLAVLWGMLKGLMDPATVNKVFISSDPGLEGLLRFMPATSIPREYGGSCTSCPGDTCLDYTRGGPFLSTPEMPFRSISVPAKAKHDVSMGHLEPGTRLEWKFMVAADDVDASVVLAHNDQVVAHVGRVTGHEGSLVTEHKGEHVMRYSNEYS